MFERYEIELMGETPLIMHACDVDAQDRLKAFQNDPANKKKGIKGDDRSPAWTWLLYLYTEAGKVVIPSDNLMTMLREGGAKCVKSGKETYKRQTQSGIVVDQSSWPLLVRGNEIPFAPLEALYSEKDFLVHETTVQGMGFELFKKRATVGSSKHVRVRPRFDCWSARGTITVLDDTLTRKVLEDIFTFAGAYAGLGDWRPSSPSKPGPWGKFSATLKKIN